MEPAGPRRPSLSGAVVGKPSRRAAGEKARLSYEEYGVREIASLIDDDPLSVSPHSSGTNELDKLDRKLKAAVLALTVSPPASIPFQELARHNEVGVYGASRHKSRIYVARTSAPNSTIGSGEIFSALVDNMPNQQILYGALSKRCATEETVLANYGSNKRIVRVECTLPPTDISTRSIEFVLLCVRSTHETTQGIIELTVATSVDHSAIPVLKDCHRGHIAFCGFAVCRQPTKNMNSDVSYVFSARPFPREMYSLYSSLESGIMATVMNVKKLYTAVVDKFTIAKGRSYKTSNIDDVNRDVKREVGYGDIIEEEEGEENSDDAVNSGIESSSPNEIEPARLRRIGNTGESSLSDRLQSCVTTVLRKEMPEDLANATKSTSPPPFQALRSKSLSVMEPHRNSGSVATSRDYNIMVEGPDSVNHLPSVSPVRRPREKSSPRCIKHYQDCHWAPREKIRPPPKRAHVREILDRLAQAKSKFFGAPVEEKMAALREMRAVYIALATHVAYNDDLLFDDENPIHLALADDYYGKNGSAMSYMKIHEASYFPEGDEARTLSEFVASRKRISQLLYRYGALPVGMARVLTYKQNNQRRRRIGSELYLRVMEDGEVSWLAVKEGDEYLESKVLGDMLGRVTRKRPVHMTSMALFCEQSHNLLSDLWGHFDSVLLIVHALFTIESHWDVNYSEDGGTLVWKSLTLDIPIELAHVLNTLKSSGRASPVRGGLNIHTTGFASWKVFSDQLTCASKILSEMQRSNDSSKTAIHVLGLLPMMKSLPRWLHAATGVDPSSQSSTRPSTRDMNSNVQPDLAKSALNALEKGGVPPMPKGSNRVFSLPDDFFARPKSPNTLQPLPRRDIPKSPSPPMTTSDDADESRPETYCKECPAAKHCTMSMARAWRDIEESAMVGKSKDLLSLSW